MDDMQAQLIDAATQDFHNDEEQCLAARKVLETRLRPGDEEEVRQAIESVKKSQAPSRCLRWSLYAVLLILSMPLVGGHIFQFFKVSSLYQSMSSYHGEDPAEDMISSQLTDQQKLLVFGDRRFADESDRKKGLWDSDPENPAYYNEYAMAYFRDHAALPTHFIEQGEELDPDNGWYRLIAAAVKSEGVVEKVTTTSGSSTGSGSGSRGWRARGESTPSASMPKKKKDQRPEWKVVDETKMQSALAELYAAMEKPRLTSYDREMLVARIKVLPESKDFLSMVSLTAYMAGQPMSKFKVTYLSKVIAAEAYRCEVENDRDALVRLIEVWEESSRRLNKDGLYLVDALITKAWMSSAVLNIRDAAKVCGMDEERARFDHLHHEFQVLKELKNKQPAEAMDDLTFRRKAGMLHQMATPVVAKQVKNPPELKVEDLEPGRRADHGFAGRVMSAAGWNLFLMVALFVWVYRYRGGRVVRRLSNRLILLMNPVDWIWILAVGVLLPWGYYWAVQLMTPLSAREESITFTLFVQASGQLMGLLLMMQSWALLIIRWRLSIRAGVFGFIRPGKIWVIAVLSTLIIPVFGMATWSLDYLEVLQYIGASLCALVEIWLLVVGCRALFGNRVNAIYRVTVSRLLLPAYAVMALLMAGSVTINQHLEGYWVQRDWMFQLSEEEPGFGRYEYRVTEQLQKELELMLDVHSVRSGK